MKRELLYILARLFYFLPDSVMLSIQYFIRTKRILHLRNPKRFTEKMQCYKAYYRNEEMQICTDKYAVRDYVKNKLGTDQYLNQLYQVCEKPEEIDFEKLPSQFVIKTTDGGNGTNVVICNDKTKLDIPSTIKRIKGWKKIKYNILSREWAYEWTSRGERTSKIIVEKYLENSENADRSLDDFKFYCYDGKFKFLLWCKNRYSGNKRNFYDESLKLLEGVGNYPNISSSFKLPENVYEMISIAEKLASGFPFARIDFYNVEGKIVFGEITFYPASGFATYHPDSFDFELGKFFKVEDWKK